MKHTVAVTRPSPSQKDGRAVTQHCPSTETLASSENVVMTMKPRSKLLQDIYYKCHRHIHKEKLVLKKENKRAREKRRKARVSILHLKHRQGGAIYEEVGQTTFLKQF